MNRVKIYIATKLEHGEKVRQELSKYPFIEITSTWLDFLANEIPCDPVLAPHFWQVDMIDVMRSDMLICYTDSEKDILRGALVEAGMALATGIPVVCVGNNQSFGSWQFHPLVQRVESLYEAVITAQQILAQEVLRRSRIINNHKPSNSIANAQFVLEGWKHLADSGNT